MRKILQHSLLLIPVILIVFTFSYCTSQQTADNASADLKIKGNFTINIFNAEDEMVQMNKGNFTHPFNIEVKMIELRNTDMDDEISLETHSIQKKLINVDDNAWEDKHYIVNSTIYIDSIVFNGDSKKDHDFEINHHIVAHTNHLITEITNETDTVKHKITSTRNWDISGEIQLPHKDSVFRYILTEELSKEYIPNILKTTEIELN